MGLKNYLLNRKIDKNVEENRWLIFKSDGVVAVWILLTGIWNDSGRWDDTALWNDGV